MPLSLAIAGSSAFVRWRALRANRLLSYGCAIALVALATVLRWVLGQHVMQGLPFITYFPAVIAAALLGGIGPGVLAALLSAALADYFFIPPIFAVLNGLPEALSIVVFLVVSLFNIALIAVLDAAVKRLFAHEQNIRTLIDAAPNGIIVVDEAGAITLANRKMEELFGYAEGELLGQPIETLLPAGRARDHAALRSSYMTRPDVRAMGEVAPEIGTTGIVGDRSVLSC